MLYFRRLLNKLNNWWRMEEFTFNGDIALIRHEAPMRGIRLDAEEPIEMSPGVYVFSGNIAGRMVRYICSVVGDNILIEPYGGRR